MEAGICHLEAIPPSIDGLQFSYFSILFSAVGSGALLRAVACSAALAKCHSDPYRICILWLGGADVHAADVFHHLRGLAGELDDCPQRVAGLASVVSTGAVAGAWRFPISNSAFSDHDVDCS